MYGFLCLYCSLYKGRHPNPLTPNNKMIQLIPNVNCTNTNTCHEYAFNLLLAEKLTRRPRSGAQSGPRIYQFVGGGGGSRNLMLSSNLLKSKIPMSGGGGGRGGGVGGTSFQLLMPSSNLLKKKNFFAKNFRSFWAKMCLGMVFNFEYRVVRYTKYSEPQ